MESYTVMRPPTDLGRPKCTQIHKQSDVHSIYAAGRSALSTEKNFTRRKFDIDILRGKTLDSTVWCGCVMQRSARSTHKAPQILGTDNITVYSVTDCKHPLLTSPPCSLDHP